MSHHTNIPAQTLTDRVSEIKANDGKTYRVIEASDWVELVSDWTKNPGKLRAKAKNGLIDFLACLA
ncbi:hypothetical protein [Leptolyngbya sp. Heron Island J]|uniref:hypothetical protein n=1 Tax=Leptolyngbya sp. Heron Island J TaxID=1385935 RepID=UPI001F4496D3|nr:hypothetical protein [Leptolyngbya sp. Heron Island J]